MDPWPDVEAVVHGKPSNATLLRRGFAKRCPRCSGRGIYDSWFRMKARCPTCGYLFEREPGFFVGAYLINFAITEGLLFVLLMGFVYWKSTHPEAGVLAVIVVGLVIGVIAPVLFYPYARTIWSAIDLAMTPLEVAEIVAAADAVSTDLPTDPPSELPSDPGSDIPGAGPRPDRAPPEG